MTQAEALQILKTGRSVFLTGEPGSGKTYLINRYLHYLRAHQVPVAITASTGIAANHIGGRTIHAWSGIGVKDRFSNQELAKLRSKQPLVKRLQKTQVLVIDEVSMLGATVIDLVDQVLKTVRANPHPFGGIQVVFVGDFFQLPPIARQNETVPFAFEATAWQEAKPLVCYLTEQHRQQDVQFMMLLQALRRGEPSSEVQTVLRARQHPNGQASTATQLYTHNVDVDRLNQDRLKKLTAKSRTFTMSGQGRKALVDNLKKGCLSPEILELKVGAQVMFTKNSFDEGFVNGTLGVVIGFEDELPVVQTKQGDTILASPLEWTVEENDKVLASISQIPLRLAWAITVHKSQGMTLDEAVMDLSSVFEYGQGYVAISRVRSLTGLWLLGLNARALQVHPRILEIDNQFRALSQKALHALARYSPEEMTAKHQAFVRRSGGTIKATAKKVRSKTERSTAEQTLQIYKQGKTILEIAKARGLTYGTIFSHLEKLKQSRSLSNTELNRLIPPALVKALPQIHQCFATQENDHLTPVYEHFHGQYSYDELRLARLVR